MSDGNPWNVMSILVLDLIVMLMLPVLAEAQEPFKESYSAFEIAMGTTNSTVLPLGVTGNLQINVTRWTTDFARSIDRERPRGPDKSTAKERKNGGV